MHATRADALLLPDAFPGIDLRCFPHGKLDVLRRIVDRQAPAACRDPPYHAAGERHALRSAGLEARESDAYVLRPAVTYNGRPVQVGHSNGLYLYYDHPDSAKEEGPAEGRCVSPPLGSRAPACRLDPRAVPAASPAPPPDGARAGPEGEPGLSASLPQPPPTPDPPGRS